MQPQYNVPMFRSIAHPITRYAGSKRRLISFIRQHLPNKWNDYFEPFCGGLSVYCAMVNEFWDTKKYWISDDNADLIHVYRYIKTDPRGMFDRLWQYHLTHSPEQWHEKNQSPTPGELPIDTAARYWYLMRHAYTNKLGRSKDESKWLGYGAMTASYYAPDLQKTLGLSEAFKETQTDIWHTHYGPVMHYIKEGDLVYLDPPYLGAYRGIYPQMMSEGDHRVLADWVWDVSKRGAYVMISNYDNEQTRELYEGMRFASKAIPNTMTNDGGDRGYVQELLAMAW